MAKLTKRTIDAARPDPTRDTFLWDDDLHGFGLRTTRAGVKSYVIQYRNRDGRSRRMTFAAVGTLTPDEAREEARQKLARVVQGGDPAEEKSSRHNAPTVKDLAERFDREHVAVKVKSSTAYTYRRLVKDFILSALGTMPVAGVTGKDVDALHHRLSKTPRQANQTIAVLSKMFALAEMWTWRQEHSNPCRHVQKFTENKRQRYLSAVELTRLGQTLATMETKGDLTSYTALLFRLLLLTGMRLGEALTLRWEHVNDVLGIVNLSDSKTGAKVVVLGAAARDLLKHAPKEGGSPWVITGGRRDAKGDWTHVSNPSKAWQRVKKKASTHEDGLPDVDIKDVTIHDLRHSFASLGAGGGLGLPVLGALLGHATPAMTARYAHIANDPLRLAADRVSGEMAALLEGRAPAPVVDMKRTRSAKRRKR